MPDPGRRIRITSDGTPYRTRVVDEETGADLSRHITGMTLHFRPGEMNRADLEIVIPQVDVIAEIGSAVACCPSCGHERDIPAAGVGA